MVWHQIDVNKPHLVYIILGGFTSLFMLCSTIIKEKLYIGEATVATLCGIIFGPHAANLIDPGTWGNTDQITLEFSRIVLVVQCFAVGVELPKAYMERHWRSVTFLLIPVMTFGWLITSLFIWGLFSPSLNWLDSLVVAACVTATDPVLASSVVGKGKFAKRVPKHLRDLLSAESGCNDGMAFPFIYLGLYIIEFRHHPPDVALHWFCYTILYECIFGAVYGVAVGYIARRAIRYAHEKEWVDRESFLVFYFVLALFCAGSGSILGIDDLLVGFACGVGFSNDGWFTEKTEESHVSNVIDLLINLAFFVYFGTIIPWAQFNAHVLNMDIWRLVVLGILVLLFRRIPIMMLLKPVIPDIKTWREALFAGHFGPIGVGAIFVSILARGEMETEWETTTPLAVLPEEGFPHWNIIEVIWPITCFLVICSILVHGSSIAVFTLGKHINTLTLTMSYTQANEQGPSWMERLPRIQSRSKSSMSLQRSDSEFDEKDKAYPPGMLPPIGKPGNFLRRQREEENPSRNASRASSRTRNRRSKRWENGSGPGGPISQSAIKPAPRVELEEPWSRSDSETLAKSESSPSSEEAKHEAKMAQQKPDVGPEPESGETEVPESGEVFEEGDQTVYEDEEGNVLAVEDSKNEPGGQQAREKFEREEGKRLMHEQGADRNHGVAPTQDDPDKEGGDYFMDGAKKAEEGVKDAVQSQRPGNKWRHGMSKLSTVGNFRKAGEASEQKPKKEEEAKTHGPARAYQYGNTIIVEDEDGEVIKKYDIPGPEKKGSVAEGSMKRLGAMGKMLGVNRGGKDNEPLPTAGPSNSEREEPARPQPTRRETIRQAEEADDERLRFSITTGAGRRLSKADFIDHIRQMDPKRRAQVVEESDAPENVKREARADAREQTSGGPRAAAEPTVPVVAEHPEEERGHRKSQPELHPVTSNEEGDLKLVDSNEEHIPFHDVSSELRKYQMRSPTGETAAERRRRQAMQRQDPDEDSEDDGTDRVPPPARAHAEPSRSGNEGPAGETAAERRRREGALGLRRSESDSDSEERPGRSGVRFAGGQEQHRPSETGETAAERRRREGALGHTEEAESDSDEEAGPRNAPMSPTTQQRQGIRFADQPPTPSEQRPTRSTTLKWGTNVGR